MVKSLINTVTLCVALLLAAGCSDDGAVTPDTLAPDGPGATDGGPDGPAKDDTGPVGDGQPADMAPDQPQRPTGWYPVGGTAPVGTWQTATLLKDGRVLITGGYAEIPDETTFADAHIYDPKTGSFAKASPMSVPRYLHTASLLPDGKVLVVGGENDATDSLDTTEVYDPQTNTWTAGPKLPEPRSRHTMVTLQNGEVLIAGGADFVSWPYKILSSLVIYVPSSNTLKLPATAMKEARYRHSACVLDTGKVLFAGGYDNDYLDSLETFDPSTGNTTLLTAKLSYARTMTTATLLKSGKVLLVGGSSYSPADDDIYDPATNTLTKITHPGGPPAGHTATLLTDGRVLIVGGREASPVGGASNMSVTVAYDPAAGGSWTPLPDLTVGRAHHAAVRLDDGTVFVVGGMFGKSDTYVDSAEVFQP